MKLLSIAIPCYNSQDYMEHCIESLLVGGEDVEILIVDDGSKDRTAEIADRYAENYPDIVKAIHQENGGHGEAVNAESAMLPGFILKWWTVTTGWTKSHTVKCWTRCGNYLEAVVCWIC